MPLHDGQQFVALERAPGFEAAPQEPWPGAPSSAALLSADKAGANVAVAALGSSQLRSIVTAARQAHGSHRVRWSLRQRLAFQELVVTRGEAA